MSRYLFVGAHPDDVEINAGGLISRLVEEQHQVWTCTLASETALNGERKQESIQAQKRLGVPYGHVHWGLGHDTRLADDQSQVISRLDTLIKKIKPDWLFTHFHADTHQDHHATYRIAMAAGRTIPNVALFKPVYPSGRTDTPFQPTLVMRLEDRHIDAKLEALREFRSQEQKYGQSQWAESVKASSAGDAWNYGGFHGWAELFQVSRLLA